MPRYTAPTEDVLFLLREVLGYESLGNLPGFGDAPLDTVEAILSEAGRVASEVFQPLNRVGDTQGCTRHADGRVTTPDGFREAFRTFAEGGWIGLSIDQAYGGQGLPYAVTSAVSEFMASANVALGAYGGLTMGADILAIGPLTGASMNPARSLGPAIASGIFEGQAVYWAGPIVGGIFAAVLYDRLFLGRAPELPLHGAVRADEPPMESPAPSAPPRARRKR